MKAIRSYVFRSTLPLLMTLACGQKKFDGGVGSQTPAKDTSNPMDTSVSGKGNTPAACEGSSVGITEAKLLSQQISRQPKIQSLKYELSAKNCKDGTAIPLRDQVLFFDLNAIIASGFTALSYSVSEASNSNMVNSGILELVKGQDLFGNVGNLAYWKTQSLSYTSNLEKLILEIKLDNITLATANPAATTIDSFLRAGESKPVTQAIGLGAE